MKGNSLKMKMNINGRFRFQIFLIQIKGLQYIYQDFCQPQNDRQQKKLFNQIRSLTRTWGYFVKMILRRF